MATSKKMFFLSVTNASWVKYDFGGHGQCRDNKKIFLKFYLCMS